MRTINSEEIIAAVKKLCIEVNFNLPEDVKTCLKKAYTEEESEAGKNVLGQIKKNAEIAPQEKLPLCQDTGTAVFFVEMGQEVLIEGEALEDAINEGVRQGYQEGFLRKSIVSDPLRRENTGDNTPAIIHLKQVEGDKLKIQFAAKGGGAENMSRLAMLKPAQGVEGVKDFVLETVQLAGANPCPPIIVGLGIGGNFEKSAELAKLALFRNLEEENSDNFYAELEDELKIEINKLGIGPQGFGGTQTCLRVLIETAPCHIASMPVAVNIQCHSARHGEALM